MSERLRLKELAGLREDGRRSGIEFDDHPDINPAQFQKIGKIGVQGIKRHGLNKYKFEIGPQEKYWVDLTLRKK